MDRRTFLGAGAATAVLGTAGCLDLASSAVEPEHRLSNDATDGIEEIDAATSQRLYGELDLSAGRYAAWSLSPRINTDLWVDVEILDGGGTLDVYLMDDGEYDRYRDGENFEYYQDVSAVEVQSESLFATIDGGEYRLVVANTGMFSTSPDGAIVVDFEAEIGDMDPR